MTKSQSDITMSQDIREHYNIHGSDVYAPSRILLRRRPAVGTQNILPGFDCLIVVLRCIYEHCMVGTDSTPGWLAAAEENNSILGYAWLMFSRDAREESLQRRKDVFRDVFTFGASFETFCTSSLMNETFWSQDVFRLFRTLRSIETGEIVKASADDIARASILEFDHAMNPRLTLDEVAKKAFGVVPFKGQDVASIPNNPWIVRLRYKPALNASERLDINGLKLLYLPVWEQLMSEADECYHEVGKAPYFLMAVVRLKDDDRREEYVRTYNSLGGNILPDDDPEHPVNNAWSIKDSPASYMLFYGLKTFVDMENPMRFAEVATPIRPPEFAWVDEMVDRELAKGRASLQKKAREGAEADADADADAEADVEGEKSYPDPASGQVPASGEAPSSSASGQGKRRRKAAQKQRQKQRKLEGGSSEPRPSGGTVAGQSSVPVSFTSQASKPNES